MPTIKKMLSWAGGLFKKQPGLTSVMERIDYVPPGEAKAMVGACLHPSTDGEITTAKENLALPGEPLVLSKTSVIDEQGRAVILNEVGYVKLLNGRTVYDLRSATHWCHIGGHLTDKEIRCAETGISLCEIHSCPHPFESGKVVAPHVAEELKNNSQAVIQQCLTQWKRARLEKKLQTAALKKHFNQRENQE